MHPFDQHSFSPQPLAGIDFLKNPNEITGTCGKFNQKKKKKEYKGDGLKTQKEYHTLGRDLKKKETDKQSFVVMYLES